MELAASEDASPEVRALAGEGLTAILNKINEMGRNPNRPLKADDTAIRTQIVRFFNRPDPTYRRTEPLAVPPGDPIGSAGR